MKKIVVIMALLCIISMLLVACQGTDKSDTEVITWSAWRLELSPTVDTEGALIRESNTGEAQRYTVPKLSELDYRVDVKSYATCTTKGVRSYTITLFDKTYTFDTDIAPLGHNYSEVTYYFAPDGSSATATRVCGNDATHVDTATAKITSEVETEPTCQDKGNTKYTATYSEVWADSHSIIVEDILAFGHDYDGVSYTISEGQCIAKRVCKRDTSHVETSTADFIEISRLAPTCTTKGVAKEEATFDVDWAEKQSRDVDIDKLPHALAMQHDDFYHYNVCSNCTGVFDKVAHTFDEKHICTTCGAYDFSYGTDGLEYTLNDDKSSYSVTEYTGTSKDIVVPKYHDGKAVTAIGDNVFSGIVGLNSVKMYEGITSIGARAFADSGIMNVTLPSSVKTLGDNAFERCERLTKATLGDGITTLTMGTFMYAKSLEEVTLSSHLERIDEGAFLYAESLQSVTFPESLVSICDNAFSHCNAITTIYVGANTSLISSSAFAYCKGLANISVSKDNKTYTSLDSNLILDKATHKLILSRESTLPAETQNIGSYAFTCATNIADFTIPATIKTVGKCAFSSSNLENITIASDDTYVDATAFNDTTILTVKTSALNAVCIPTTATYIDITIGTELIEYALSDHTALTKLTLPDTLDYIGYGAFANCTSLVSIVIPATVTYIDMDAFLGCANLAIYMLGNNEQDFDPLFNPDNRPIYHYSATTAANAWHYVDGVPTLW